MDRERILANAHRVFAVEEEALKAVESQLGNEFVELVERSNAALDRGGKLVLTGIGKSGYIGKKIAATLSSIGSTAVFLHPVEALHGDFGIMRKGDLMIALSYSGETDELLTMITHAKRLGVELVSICGKADCRLGRLSALVVTMLVGLLLLMVTGVAATESIGAVIGCITTFGPGLGPSGGFGSYVAFPIGAKWICSFLMLLARLEFLTVLILFLPGFWRRR